MNSKSGLKLGRLALGALMLSGCYTTTVSSGKPPAQASIAYDEKWHHGVVWGIAELSGPYDLERICPAGWSEIKTETSFVNGFAEAVTNGIYAPQSITVRCAVPAKPATAPAALAVPAAATTTARPEPAAASPAVPAAASPAASAPPEGAP